MGSRLISIDHVQLAMPAGKRRSRRLFTRKFSARPAAEACRALAARGGCWFSNGSVTLHLGVEEGFRPAQKAHPAVLVENLDDLCQALSTEGHEVRFDDEIPEVRRCYVDDPFGNRIELIEG